MDVPVDNKIVEYILRCSFKDGTIDFEVKDLVKVSIFLLLHAGCYEEVPAILSGCRHTLELTVMLIYAFVLHWADRRSDLSTTCHLTMKTKRKKRERWNSCLSRHHSMTPSFCPQLDFFRCCCLLHICLRSFRSN